MKHSIRQVGKSNIPVYILKNWITNDRNGMWKGEKIKERGKRNKKMWGRRERRREKVRRKEKEVGNKHTLFLYVDTLQFSNYF